MEETVSVKKYIEKVSEDGKEVGKADEDGKLVTKQDNANTETEQSESAANEYKEEVDELEEFKDSENVNENVSKTCQTIDNSNGTKTKTLYETIITQETPNGTETIVTTTTLTKEANPSTTIPPTPTTEEKHIEKKNSDAEPLIKKEQQAQNVKYSATKAESENIVEKEEEESEYEEEVEEQDEEVEEENDGLEEQAKTDKKIVNEKKESSKEDQVQRPEKPQQSDSIGDTVVDAPSSTATNTNHLNIQNKQDNLNSTLKDIISSIDSNIIAEENIAALKERELELIKKQQELAKEIQQQQLLAQKLASENHLKQRQINNKFIVDNNESIIPQNTNHQPINNVSKYSTYEEKQDDNMYTRRSESFETRESTNVSKKIDLQKIFTPATDVEEILPKNRKLYASSAFYSSTLHPTVEDQVELARRISHSLSDISNQQSRGQSMYVNRKKRSVKWVHEGCGQDYHHNQQQPKPSTSPSILPAYTDAAKHRLQLNLHQEELLEKYAKPGLKVVQTPWEAALSSGSASTAFVEEQKLSPYPTSTLIRSATPQIHDASQGVLHHQNLPTVPDIYDKATSEDDYHKYPAGYKLQQAQPERKQYTFTNSQRELAYKPSIPQGWKAPNMSLPKDLYMPKEIPMKSYAPPPDTSIPASESPYSSNEGYDIKPINKYTTTASTAPFMLPETISDMTKPFIGTNTFPINNKPYQQGFSSTTYGSTQPPKKQYLPTQSYQTVPQNNQNVAQVNFNPSPLPYEKLAKFENPTTDDAHHSSCRNYYLNSRTKTSATPLVGSQHRPYISSSETYNYGGTANISSQAVSSFGRNTPNPHTNIISNQLLNTPTYNSLARGWGSSNGNSGISTSYQSPPNYILPSSKYHIIDNTVSVPYTDF